MFSSTNKCVTWFLKMSNRLKSEKSLKMNHIFTSSFNKDKMTSGDDNDEYKNEKEVKNDDNSVPYNHKVYDASREGKHMWDKGMYPSNSDYDKSQAKFSFRPTGLSSDQTSIVLFPGQGTHFVGMGKRLIEYRNVKRMYEAASEILDYDLYKVSVEGPKEKLDRTSYQQPAIFVASLAAVERLKHENPEIVENCIGTAGFSLGEITALTFAGAFSFNDAITLIKARAEAMQLASEEYPGGMMTVFTNHESKLGEAINTAKNYTKKMADNNSEAGILDEDIIDCRIASYLHPDCKVIAGNMKALEFIEMNKDFFKIDRLKRLSVSGAFHTNLMNPAIESFTEALDLVNIAQPQIPVHKNIDGKPYYSRKQIYDVLPDQMVKAVKWEQTMHTIYERQNNVKFPSTFICGPGASLKLLLSKVNKTASQSCTVIKC